MSNGEGWRDKFNIHPTQLDEQRVHEAAVNYILYVIYLVSNYYYYYYYALLLLLLMKSVSYNEKSDKCPHWAYSNVSEI